MTLKELRIWHHGEMNKHTRLGAVYAVHRAQSDFHLAAILAISEAIGGSVEQDIADAKALADLIPPASYTAACQGINKVYVTNLAGEWVEPKSYKIRTTEDGRQMITRGSVSTYLEEDGPIDPSDTPC